VAVQNLLLALEVWLIREIDGHTSTPAIVPLVAASVKQLLLLLSVVLIGLASAAASAAAMLLTCLLCTGW
jgi:hypothetical protein